MDDGAPTSGVGLATSVCVANAIWTAGWLGLAGFSLATCRDNPSGEQQCGGEIGLFFIWLVGYLMLIPPTFWAASVLIRAEKERPEDWWTRLGLSAFAVAFVVPIIVIGAILVMD
jgi:hypothetical protein